MQKFAAATCFALALVAGSAEAGTYLYQPTPYPKKDKNGGVMPTDIKVVHFWEGTRYVCTWCNGTGIYNFQENEILRLGGWGDWYMPVLKFDLTGLPSASSATSFWLNAIPSGSPLSSQVAWCRISSSWDLSTIGGSTQPSADQCWATYPNTGTGWRGYDITDWYNQWKSGTSPNYGIILWPNNNDGQNRFDHFTSSRSTDALIRPKLAFTFEPTLQLKMPLDYNLKWLVTTEIGGYDCRGTYDQYHDGNNYFSIDFSWRNKNANDALVYPSPDPSGNKLNNGVYIPVRAAASGVVAVSGYTPGNGNYIVIDHDWDNNVGTGFQTWYLHIQPGWQVAQNTNVQYGEVIGYMGNTGISDGPHLHFGVRYKDKGASNIPELSKVVMENKLLKSYQTECDLDSSGKPTQWNKYYP